MAPPVWLSQNGDRLPLGGAVVDSVLAGAAPFRAAQLDTMPVIEQAKGILMAQYRCRPEEAFDLLRRASQSANVKISVLAAQIVDQVSAHESPPATGPQRLRSGDGGVRTTVRRAR